MLLEMTKSLALKLLLMSPEHSGGCLHRTHDLWQGGRCSCSTGRQRAFSGGTATTGARRPTGRPFVRPTKSSRWAGTVLHHSLGLASTNVI